MWSDIISICKSFFYSFTYESATQKVKLVIAKIFLFCYSDPYSAALNQSRQRAQQREQQQPPSGGGVGRGQIGGFDVSKGFGSGGGGSSEYGY